MTTPVAIAAPGDVPPPRAAPSAAPIPIQTRTKSVTTITLRRLFRAISLSSTVSTGYVASSGPNRRPSGSLRKRDGVGWGSTGGSMGTDVLGTGLPWVDAIAGSFPPYSFAGFHRDALPALVERNGALVVED